MQNLASPEALKWADSHVTNDPWELRATNTSFAIPGNMGNAVNPVY